VRRVMVGFNEVERRSLKWAGAFRKSIAFNVGGIFVDVRSRFPDKDWWTRAKSSHPSALGYETSHFRGRGWPKITYLINSSYRVASNNFARGCHRFNA